MNQISDENLLQSYIAQYTLCALFESNMAGHMRLFLCRKGEYVCQSATQLPYLYFLVWGKLKVYSLQGNGKSLLLRFYNPLSVIGDVEFINKLPVRCHVEAQTDAHLIGIAVTDLQQYAYDDPVFLRFLIEQLSYKLYAVSNTASLNQLYPLENRLASYLLSVTGSSDNTVRTEELQSHNLTDIAMLLGTSYRHLHRVMEKFRKEGILAKQKGTLIITNLPKLQSLAKENLYE